MAETIITNQGGRNEFSTSKSGVLFTGGTQTLFTVTGAVLARLFAICTETATSGGSPTAEAGTVGNTASILQQINLASGLTAGHIWTQAGGLKSGSLVVVPAFYGGVICRSDIILTISSTWTAGIIDIFGSWRPLSSGGLLVPA